MSDLSRREFLRKSSIGVAAGAAAAGGLIGAGKTAAATGHAATDAGDSTASATPADEHVVAHIRKGEGSEVHLLVGEREIVTKDPQLVRRILRVSGK